VDSRRGVGYILAGLFMKTVQPVQFIQEERVLRKRYTGQVVYIYAFDVAYEMVRDPVLRLLGQRVEPFKVDSSKRNPRRMYFYRPQMVSLPSVLRDGPLGRVRVERVVKVFPVGALSITVRVPFEVDSIEDLVDFHDLQLGHQPLNEEVRQLAESVRRELAPYCIRPVPELADEEAYTVFCVESPLHNPEGLPITAENWLLQHRRQVASLLTQESDIANLSKQEADESTGRYLSYYQNDVVVIDWDAAIMVDEPKDFDETLYVMEMANLQLAELEAYDRILDGSLDRAYRDLSDRFRTRAYVLHELREIRIDLARLSDELSNFTKFFGDWHLARVYESITARFHLGDWHKTIDKKLDTLDDLYQLLAHDQNNRWMLLLEATIVLLFIIDLIILFLGLKT
jgi:hypothetical protein